MFRDRDGWRVQWRDATGRHSQKFESKRDAEKFERNLKDGYGVRETGARLTLSELADRWMRDYCRLEKAESQWVTDESAIRIHLKPALGELELRELTKAKLVEFRLGMRQKVHGKSGRLLSPKTVNHVLALLAKMLHTAVDWDLIPAYPTTALKPFRESEQKVSYWTEAERDRFIRFAKQLDPTFAEIVTVAVWSGLRMSELAGLTVKQLDFTRRIITVDRIYCFKSKQRLDKTKNRSIGYVPMADAIVETLKRCRLMATTDTVFNLEDFRHGSQRIRRMAKKAGVTSIRFHDLRHTFASTLVQSGVELYTVQRMMRHKTPSMTQRYAHLAPNTLQAAMARIDGTLESGVARRSGTQESEKSGLTSEIAKLHGAVGRI